MEVTKENILAQASGVLEGLNSQELLIVLAAMNWPNDLQNIMGQMMDRRALATK